ncbi:MAG: hypothetical protein K8R67_03755 [Desulfobacteraceae bacterium]|nr:hypothetical protein [Desulfobacteraceae bacterium]
MAESQELRKDELRFSWGKGFFKIRIGMIMYMVAISTMIFLLLVFGLIDKETLNIILEFFK